MGLRLVYYDTNTQWKAASIRSLRSCEANHTMAAPRSLARFSEHAQIYDGFRKKEVTGLEVVAGLIDDRLRLNPFPRRRRPQFANRSLFKAALSSFAPTGR